MQDDDADLAEFERELREAAAQLDPVPDHLPQYATAVFDWRAVDAELAELTFDSATFDEPALTRGSEPPRLLTFQTDALIIELEVAGTGRDGPLIGQLVPAQPAEVELQHGAGRLAVSADALGRFTISAPGVGPLRLRCQLTSGDHVITDWFGL